MTPRALVIGADGMIGRALADALTAAGEAPFETTRRRGPAAGGRSLVDLSADPASWELPDAASAAYLCAGATSVEECERDPAGTARVNVEATLALAGALTRRGAFVVFLSTNIVFDGEKPRARADDEPRPRAEYGRQKLAVERELLRRPDAAAVVRLTKVLGPRPRLFRDWIESLRAERAIAPFADKVMAPVPLPFAVEALRRVGERRLAGITQVSGPRDASYAEIAGRLARRVGADPGLVRPVSARGARLAAALAPAHTTLDVSRLRDELGLEPPDVWEAVEWSLR